MIAILLVIVVPLLLGEFTELAPVLALWLTQAAARRLPREWREIYEIEWVEELKEAPGKLWKLRWAAGFWIKLPVILRTARQIERAPEDVLQGTMSTFTDAQLSLVNIALNVETSEHQISIAGLTAEFCRFMNFPENQVERMETGACLHDIGKSAIPASILYKPQALTSTEFQYFTLHTTFGFELAKSMGIDATAQEIILHHHERWDGCGYPKGLSGNAIPISARLFAIIDVYDALTSERPYKRAWSHSRAMEHLREAAGNQFDPELVKAFEKFIEQTRV